MGNNLNACLCFLPFILAESLEPEWEGTQKGEQMTEQTLEEKLNAHLASKSLGIINVAGKEVNIREVDMQIEIFYDAYVELKGSHLLSDEALDYPTYRDDDIVGVDTGHAYNEDQTPAEKVIDAIKQITEVIESAETALAKVRE